MTCTRRGILSIVCMKRSRLAFDKAGIDMPLTTQSVIVQVDPKTIEPISSLRLDSNPTED